LTSTVLNRLKPALNILYPLYCGGCNAHGNILCKTCRDSLRSVEPEATCPLCGAWIGRRIICGECIGEKRGFLEGYYGFYFEDRLRESIHAFKFRGRKDVGRHLVRLLDERIRSLANRFDFIVPMAVTEKRLKERGFNQSFIIGEEISRMTGRTVCHSTLFKEKETEDQYNLSRDERKKNVKGAFAAKDDGRLRGKRVLLVDDLYTTGYTAKDACRALAKLGVREILFFALARTP
jgi:ComF family protein